MASTTGRSPTASTTSETSINTWGVVTTTGVQIVPVATSGANSPSSTDSSPFPIAAIVVIAIVGGVVFFVVAYKLYAWWYRRSRGEDLSNPYPEARQPLAGQNNPSAMSMAFGSPASPTEGGFGSVWHGRSRSSMAFGDVHTQERNPYESSPQFSSRFSPELGGSGSNTPTSPNGGSSISREPSPFGLDRPARSRNASGASAGWGGSTSGMASASSRGSLAAGQRRSAYGSSTYNGPQLRSPSSSSRLSGAPHAPHSRIDIVPPLPLAPPPGTVVSTDKSTLDFSPISGVGNGQWLGEAWIVNARGEQERSYGPRNPAFDGEYARSTSTPSSSGHSFPPSQRGRDTRAPPPTRSSPTASPPRSYPSSDSSPSSSSSGLPRPALPTLNTHLSPSGYPALHAIPTSPLEKLQQRMTQEAHREQKAQDRRERVRRANGGEDGTFEGSSGSGSAGEKVEGVGGYRAPSTQLEELVSKR